MSGQCVTQSLLGCVQTNVVDKAHARKEAATAVPDTGKKSLLSDIIYTFFFTIYSLGLFIIFYFNIYC